MDSLRSKIFRFAIAGSRTPGTRLAPLAVMCLCAAGLCRAQQGTTFAEFFPGQQGGATVVHQTSDGGYILLADTSTRQFSGSQLSKLDATGKVTWQQTYAAPGVGCAFAAIEQTSDGGYIGAGSTALGSSTSDMCVLKLDGSGNVTWAKTYGGNHGDSAASIQQSSDGGYIVAGAAGSAAWILKLDTNGNATWQNTYGATNAAWVISIQQTSDGGYVAAGSMQTSDPTGFNDTWILKLDASGNVTWQNTYSNSDGEYPSSIQQTSDGGYIVAGSLNASSFSGSFGGWVLKLDASGNVTWQKTYPASSVQQTSDGGYIMAGYAGGPGSILKADGTGAFVWGETLSPGPFTGGLISFQSVQQTSDGGYVAAGLEQPFGVCGLKTCISNDGWLVVKLDSSGSLGSCPRLAPLTFVPQALVSTVNAPAISTGASAAAVSNPAFVAGPGAASKIENACL
jgi:hypothetical protein